MDEKKCKHFFSFDPIKWKWVCAWCPLEMDEKEYLKEEDNNDNVV